MNKCKHNHGNVCMAEDTIMIDKAKLLEFANQMEIEANAILAKTDDADYGGLEYNGGIVKGINRIVKLIERQ